MTDERHHDRMVWDQRGAAPGYYDAAGNAQPARQEQMIQSPALANKVNNPAHYTKHPSGIECIIITEHMGFNLGNAVKYIWRADLKDNAQEDLRKAIWYLERELRRREE